MSMGEYLLSGLLCFCQPGWLPSGQKNGDEAEKRMVERRLRAQQSQCRDGQSDCRTNGRFCRERVLAFVIYLDDSPLILRSSVGSPVNGTAAVRKPLMPTSHNPACPTAMIIS